MFPAGPAAARRRSWAVVAAIAAAALALAPGAAIDADAAVRPPRLQYRVSKLANGLTVMLSEDHSAPIVHVQKRTEHASRRSRQTTSSVSRGRTSHRAA